LFLQSRFSRQSRSKEYRWKKCLASSVSLIHPVGCTSPPYLDHQSQPCTFKFAPSLPGLCAGNLHHISCFAVRTMQTSPTYELTFSSYSIGRDLQLAPGHAATQGTGGFMNHLGLGCELEAFVALPLPDSTACIWRCSMQCSASYVVSQNSHLHAKRRPRSQPFPGIRLTATPVSQQRRRS